MERGGDSRSALQIGNWFVRRARKDSGGVLSVMKILKLAYIAHGWHLGLTGEPLFADRIQAWRYGPVIPTLYDTFRDQGMKVEHEVRKEDEVPLNEESERILEKVWEKYSGFTAFQLSEITHQEGAPWQVASSIGGYYAPIPDALVRDYYYRKSRINIERKEAAASK